MSKQQSDTPIFDAVVQEMGHPNTGPRPVWSFQEFNRKSLAVHVQPGTGRYRRDKGKKVTKQRKQS